MIEKDALTVLMNDLGDYICNPDENAFLTKETALQAMLAIQAMDAELRTIKGVLGQRYGKNECQEF